MSIDGLMLVGAIMVLLYMVFELALTYGRGFVLFVLVLGILGISIAYQSAQASSDAEQEVQVFAGVELHSQEEADKLADEIEKELKQED